MLLRDAVIGVSCGTIYWPFAYSMYKVHDAFILAITRIEESPRSFGSS